MDFNKYNLDQILALIGSYDKVSCELAFTIIGDNQEFLQKVYDKVYDILNKIWEKDSDLIYLNSYNNKILDVLVYSLDLNYPDLASKELRIIYRDLANRYAKESDYLYWVIDKYLS